MDSFYICIRMKKLAQREEQIMKVLWENGPSFVKEIVEGLPEPRPHYNSASTMVRILETKGFVAHEAFGKSHRYYAIVAKEDYQETAVNDVLGRLFNNSLTDLITFFAKKEEVDEKELSDIMDIIKNKKNK